VLPHEKRQADAVDRGSNQQLHIVDDQWAVRTVPKVEAPMLRRVARRFRFRLRLAILRGANNRADRPTLSRHHVVLDEFTEMDAGVDVTGDQIHAHLIRTIVEFHW